MPVLARFGAQPGIVEDARQHYARSGPAHLQGPLARGRAAPRAPRQQPRHRRAAARFDARQARPVAAQDRRGAFPRQSSRRSFALERARILAAARSAAPERLGRDSPAPRSPRTNDWRTGAPTPPRSSPADRGLRDALEALLRDAARALHRRAVGSARARSSSSCRAPPRTSRWCSPSAARPTSPKSRKAPCARSARPRAPTDLLLALDYRVSTSWSTSSRTPRTRSGSS